MDLHWHLSSQLWVHALVEERDAQGARPEVVEAMESVLLRHDQSVGMRFPAAAADGGSPAFGTPEPHAQWRSGGGGGGGGPNGFIVAGAPWVREGAARPCSPLGARPM